MNDKNDITTSFDLWNPTAQLQRYQRLQSSYSYWMRWTNFKRCPKPHPADFTPKTQAPEHCLLGPQNSHTPEDIKEDWKLILAKKGAENLEVSKAWAMILQIYRIRCLQVRNPKSLAAPHFYEKLHWTDNWGSKREEWVWVSRGESGFSQRRAWVMTQVK